MAAAEFLDHLQKRDLTELKSFKTAPAAVKMVLEAICILRGIKPINNDYWKASVQMMGDPKFLDNLKTFDKDKVSGETLELIRTKYLSDPNFDPDWLRQVSYACEWLCKWVIAIAE